MNPPFSGSRMVNTPSSRVAPRCAVFLGAGHLARGADLARGRRVAARGDAVGDEVADVLPADADGERGARADGADAKHARPVRHDGVVARELARGRVRVTLGPPKVGVVGRRELVHLRRDHLAVGDERRVVRPFVVDAARAAPARGTSRMRRRRFPCRRRRASVAQGDQRRGGFFCRL